MPVAIPREGESNRKIIAAKLTRATAEAVAKVNPGAYIEKVVADNTPRMTSSSLLKGDSYHGNQSKKYQ